jgi:hypothetical protein
LDPNHTKLLLNNDLNMRNSKIKLVAFTVLVICMFGCQYTNRKSSSMSEKNIKKGSFGYDLAYLKSHQKPVLLSSADSLSQVIVSTEFQGRVMTSTSGGLHGMSYGWLNYKAIDSDSVMPHINAYGGEDRLWLGPEGGQFSIYFKKGDPFDFEHWQTPKELDSEPFELISHSKDEASFEKHFSILNYTGTGFKIKINRSIRLLDKRLASSLLSAEIPESVEFVGYETENKITNQNDFTWDEKTGMLSIWILGMYVPSPGITVVLPYKQGDEKVLGKILTDDYFGKVPGERLKLDSGFIFFKCDGKYRSKIGVSPARALPFAASYDEDNQVLTIVNYSLPANGKYVNSQWKIQTDPFSGDVTNSYNDGPVADGTQMGPFYEIESSSPAGALKPGASLTHFHRTFHFHGSEDKLNAILHQVMGISLDKVKLAFD